MKKISLLALALTAASFGASAYDLGYNHVEVGYQQGSQHTKGSFATPYGGVSVSNLRPKGYYVDGSVELGESPFYVFGNYARGTDTFTAHAVDERLRFRSAQQRYELGLGYHYAINPRLNLLAESSYINFQDKLTWEHLTERSHGNDLRFAFGVDSMLTESLEGWAKLNYTKGDSMLKEVRDVNGNYTGHTSDGKIGTSLGMQYKFNSVWGVTGQADFASGANGYKVGVRASF